MIKKLAIAFVLLFAARAHAEIRITHPASGLSIYARVQTGASTFFAVALTEGSGGSLHKYVATDAQILTAATTLADSTGNGYTFVLYIGTPSTTNDDPIIGDGLLPWRSNAEVSLITVIGTPSTTIAGDIAAGGGGGGGSTTTVDNTKVVQSRVRKLGTRADGVTAAFPDIQPRTGETLPWWVDTTAFAGGDWLESVSNVATSDASAVAITMNGDVAKAGVNREMAVVWLTPVWTSGHESADITFDLTPRGGETIKVTMHAKKPTQ